MHVKTLVAGALALALSGCSGNSHEDPYLASVPDAAGLALEVQAAPATGALTSAGDDLAVVREKVDAVNAEMTQAIERIEELASRGGTQLPGGVKTYGPVDRCVAPVAGGGCADGGTATLKLTIQLLDGGKGRFLLEARPAGTPESFQPIAAGWMIRGQLARRGAGQIAVSLDAVRAVAPAFPGEGVLLAGFWSGAHAKAGTFGMRGFTRDATVTPPATAAFRGFRTDAGALRVRVAGIGDLDPSGPDVELGFWRGAYHPLLGGRAFTVITNFIDAGGTPHGDVPSLPGGPAYWFGRACYTPAKGALAFKEWFLCPRGIGPAACVAQQGSGTQVAGTTGATWESACPGDAEPVLALPSAVPALDAEDTTVEEGGASTLAQPVPADVASVVTAP